MSTQLQKLRRLTQLQTKGIINNEELTSENWDEIDDLVQELNVKSTWQGGQLAEFSIPGSYIFGIHNDNSYDSPREIVVVTPKLVWENENIIDDSSIFEIEVLLGSLGLYQVMENAYEGYGKVDIDKLVNVGFEYRQDLTDALNDPNYIFGK